MWGTRYLVAYVLGTLVGVFNEFVQKPQQPCYQQPNYGHVLTCGACNLYGWGTLAITAFFDFMTMVKAPAALTLLAIAPILTALEAAMGSVSKWYFGEQRWSYPSSYYPALDSTVSLVSTTYFTVAGLLYWAALYRPVISKL